VSKTPRSRDPDRAKCRTRDVWSLEQLNKGYYDGNRGREHGTESQSHSQFESAQAGFDSLFQGIEPEL
jgi:hypothetical protein